MRRTLVALAVAALATGCGDTPLAGSATPKPKPATNRFDGARAFSFLERQVRLGPRPAGSVASRTLAGWLQRRVPHGRVERVPGGLRNVVGHLPGRKPRSCWVRTTTPRTPPRGLWAPRTARAARRSCSRSRGR